MNIIAMKEKRADLIRSAQAIADKAKEDDRNLTDEETAEFDGFLNKAEEMKADIEKAEAREKRLLDMSANLDKPAPRSAPAKPGREPQPQIAVARPRYGKLKAFKGDSGEDNAFAAGQWILGFLYGNEKSKQWCREHGVYDVAGEGVNTKGGFLVPEQFTQAIIDLREEYGVFRRECRVMPMSSDSMTIPRREGGITAYFVGENDEVTASDKSWGQVQLTAKKLGALCKYSSELAEDAIISIADDLANEMAYAFAEKEDDCGFNGDGTSTYGGIHGVRTKIIDGNHTAGAVDAASGIDTFAEITATDLATAMAALPQYAHRSAKWYCSQPAFELVFSRLTAAAGGNTIDTLAGMVQPRYLGYPIVISQKMPTSTGDLSNVAMLLFGDLRLAATMGDRRGIRAKISEDRYLEYDQVGILGTERFDINVHDLGDTSTAGPIVALVGE